MSLISGSIKQVIMYASISEKASLQIAILKRQHTHVILFELVLYELFLVYKGAKLSGLLVQVQIRVVDAS